ncbi:MAG: LysR family transcriptional regulator [Clostridia bacterium]|nr:MAG: LysR family transcriptional regulator [Clostridia bacterium]
MAVRLELYRVFLEVAKQGNISAAAQNLFISQSAVSQSVKQLEEQLQVRLFSRSTRGVSLTSEGKLLLEYVSHALGLLQSGEEKIAASRQLLTGELIIGASDTVTKTYLLSRLEAFHKDYPDIRIRILNGTTSMVLDYLHAGQVDIAFASEAPDETVYSVRHCVDTHTIFVAAPDYLEFDKVYTMEEIAALPLILLERKASSRVYVERYFQDHGVQIHPEIELGSHNLLISLARIGLGVACVTEEFSLSGLSRGVIVPLKTDFEIPPRAVTMCTLQGVTPTSAANRFMDFITETNRMAYDPGHSYHFTNS